MRRRLSQCVPSWRVVSVGTLLVILCGVVGVAEGYILPIRYFLKMYAKQRASFPRLKISQTTTSWQGNTKTTYEEKVYIRVPAKVRVERWSKGKRTQVDVWSGSQHMQWRAGSQVRSTKRRVQHRFDLFAVERAGSGYGNISTLIRYMRICTRGVRKYSRHSDYLEQKCARLTWFQHAPTLVLGRRNQLWMHKKLFYPTRFLAGVTKGRAKYDLRFYDYHFRAGIPVYPGRVVLFVGGKRRSQSLVSQVETNAAVPQRLFTSVK